MLSRLLFQRAAGGLSPLQALQLAQAAAQLSGGGPDAFEEVRRALGVDDLDVNFANGGARRSEFPAPSATAPVSTCAPARVPRTRASASTST